MHSGFHHRLKKWKIHDLKYLKNMVTKRFSAIPIDQAHKQNNELVKSSGGKNGLTKNP